MSQPTATPAPESNLHFNIGKSQGLDNQKTPIDQYKQRLTAIAKELESAVEAAWKDFEKQGTDTVNRFTILRDDMLAGQADIIQELKKLTQDIAEVMNIELKDANYLKEKILPVCDTIVTRFQNKLLQNAQREDELLAAIREIPQKYAGLLDGLERKQTKFLDDLEQKHKELRDLELGFLYGEALRMALNP